MHSLIMHTIIDTLSTVFFLLNCTTYISIWDAYASMTVHFDISLAYLTWPHFYIFYSHPCKLGKYRKKEKYYTKNLVNKHEPAYAAKPTKISVTSVDHLKITVRLSLEFPVIT